MIPLLVLSLLIAVTPAHAAPAPRSLYTAPLKWVDDSGKNVKLGDWRGKKVVIAMMYASCHGACPLIVQKLRKVESLFQERKIDASFVLVTFDPASDTPKKLHDYKERIGLAGPRWTFLTGTPTGVRQLSMLLGIKYRKDGESGEIMHDNKIMLLSEEGEIVGRLEGLHQDEKELLGN